MTSCCSSMLVFFSGTLYHLGNQYWPSATTRPGSLEFHEISKASRRIALSQSAPAAPCPRVATAAPNTPTRLLGAALRAREERPRHLNAEWSRGGALLPARTVAELLACLQAAYALALLLEVRKYDQSLDWLLERSRMQVKPLARAFDTPAMELSRATSSASQGERI